MFLFKNYFLAYIFYKSDFLFIKMDYSSFIEEKIEEIKDSVGNEKAIVALSGRVDSAVTAILAKRALGNNLEAYFIDDYLNY